MVLFLSPRAGIVFKSAAAGHASVWGFRRRLQGGVTRAFEIFVNSIHLRVEYIRLQGIRQPLAKDHIFHGGFGASHVQRNGSDSAFELFDIRLDFPGIIGDVHAAPVGTDNHPRRAGTRAKILDRPFDVAAAFFLGPVIINSRVEYRQPYLDDGDDAIYRYRLTPPMATEGSRHRLKDQPLQVI